MVYAHNLAPSIRSQTQYSGDAFNCDFMMPYLRPAHEPKYLRVVFAPVQPLQGFVNHFLHIGRLSAMTMLEDVDSEFEEQALVGTLEEPSLDLTWFHAAIELETVAAKDLVPVVNGIRNLAKASSFGLIDLVLKTVKRNLNATSPEVMLCFVRVTYQLRDYLHAWRPFLHAVKEEVDRRGLNSRKMLSGLL